MIRINIMYKYKSLIIQEATTIKFYNSNNARMRAFIRQGRRCRKILTRKQTPCKRRTHPPTRSILRGLAGSQPNHSYPNSSPHISWSTLPPKSNGLFCCHESFQWILAKSVKLFFRNPANKRTNKQKTNADENITFLADITTGPYKVANWLHPGSGLISDAQTAHRMDSETESEKHNRYIESNFIAICSQLLGQFRSQAHTETQTHINSFIGANKNPRDLKTNPPKLSCSFLTSNLYCI